MLGYGTKVGLAPLHAWLPDAHAEGPTPISAVLSGLLLNVALYAVLRFKLLLDANARAIAPGPLMATLGLVSLIFAAFMLYRRRDIKRLFAFSSIEHMGIIVFAFGMGGALANFAGLLHMTMHSLTKSAIFFIVGHIAQVKGTQRIADITGLTVSQPWLGWSLVVGVFAIAGLPPLGVFMSEFLVVTSTFARSPALALIFVFGLLVAFGALMTAAAGHGVRRADGRRPAVARLPRADRRASRRSCCWRACIRRRRWCCGSSMSRRCCDERRPRKPGSTRRVGSPPARRRWSAYGATKAASRMALATLGAREIAIADARHARTAPSPRSAPRIAPAIRLERAIADLHGLKAIGAPDARPWLDHGRWPIERAARRGGAQRNAAAALRISSPPRGRGCIRFRSGRSMPAIIEPGHFRFHASGETVVRLEERLGYVHKGVDALMRGATLEARRVARRRGSAATARSPIRSPSRAPPRRRWASRRRRARVWLRAADGRTASASPITSATSARSATTPSFALMHAHCGALARARAARLRRGVRPSADDGRVVPGGVARRSRRRRRGGDPRADRRRSRRLSAAGRALRQHRLAARPHRAHRAFSRNALAAQFGCGGYVGRASGRDFDARRAFPYPPYDELTLRCSRAQGGRRQRAGLDTHPRGRAEPATFSTRFCCARRPAPIRAEIAARRAARATRWSRVSAATSSSRCASPADGTVANAHLRDPSWFQWPLLEAAIEGNIVADFPLCNKSFNCSYSGHDL